MDQNQVETKKIVLSGNNLTKIIGENVILKDMNIDIYAGDFTVIMGSSGAGKSTLLYVLSGMDQLTSGELIYDDRNLTVLSERERTRLRANDFGFVFQQMNLISNLSLYENIKMAGLIADCISTSIAEERADRLIEQMNLVEAKDRLPSQASGGEVQRAAVARAVIGNPKIIFADEPTGALNKANTEEVLNLFSSLNKNEQSILLVTHEMEAAIRGNRILYLEDGKMIGELKLSEYQGKDEKREALLTDWLKDLRW